MDWTGWTFDGPELDIRKIQEAAAQTVVDLMTIEDAHIFLAEKISDGNGTEPPVISVYPLDIEDDAPHFEFELTDAFRDSFATTEWLSPKQLEYVADFLEGFAAKCRAAANSSQTP